MTRAAWGGRPTDGATADAGFSLVELLVALVILPLIIGAAATAVVSSEQNSISLKNRVSDSANATLTAANFEQDVQSAALITTSKTATSPTPVCGTGLMQPAKYLTGTNLLVALGRPSSTGTASYSIAYWESDGTPNEAVRDACPWGSATITSQVVLSDDVSSYQREITPGSFKTAASNGWTPTSASSTVTAATSLGTAAYNLPVSYGQAFSAGTAYVESCTNTSGCSTSPEFVVQTISCAGASLTNCTGGSGIAPVGGAVTQFTNVAAVHLEISQSASSYVIDLRASPRLITSLTNGGGQDIGQNPALLTLGTGVTLQGASGVNISVNGIIDTSAGNFNCSNVPASNVTATGFESTGSPNVGTCLSSTPTSVLTSPTQDPLANSLPIPFPQTLAANCYGTGTPDFASVTTCSPLPTGGNPTCSPGEYTSSLPDGCALMPGVYILDVGFNDKGNLGLSMATNTGDGVLLYLPCTVDYCSSSITMGGRSSLNLRPLTTAQAVNSFGAPGLAGVEVWQDVRNATTATLSGTPTASATGTFYLPGASVTLIGNSSQYFGQVIAASVYVQGSGTLNINPPPTTP